MFFDILAGVSVPTFDEIYWEIVQRLYFQIIMGGSWVDQFCPTVLTMNFIDNIKLKMVVDNDIEVPIHDVNLQNIEISYDICTVPECLFTYCMPVEFYCLFTLINDLKSSTKISAEKFVQYISCIRSNEYIDCIMKLLNKYNRTDLIAMLLDKNKYVKSFGDFEL